MAVCPRSWRRPRRRARQETHRGRAEGQYRFVSSRARSSDVYPQIMESDRDKGVVETENTHLRQLNVTAEQMVGVNCFLRFHYSHITVLTHHAGRLAEKQRGRHRERECKTAKEFVEAEQRVGTLSSHAPRTDARSSLMYPRDKKQTSRTKTYDSVGNSPKRSSRSVPLSATLSLLTDDADRGIETGECRDRGQDRSAGKETSQGAQGRPLSNPCPLC